MFKKISIVIYLFKQQLIVWYEVDIEVKHILILFLDVNSLDSWRILSIILILTYSLKTFHYNETVGTYSNKQNAAVSLGCMKWEIKVFWANCITCNLCHQ